MVQNHKPRYAVIALPYVPNAESKTVLVDSMLMFIDNWHTISTDVWKSPTEISGRIRTNNIVLDSLTVLAQKHIFI